MKRISLPGMSSGSSAATLAVLLCSTALPAAAQSACVLDPATSVYICSSTGPGTGTGPGLALGTTDGLSVTIEEDAAIAFVQAGNDLVLNNAGTLSNSGDGVAAGTGATIDNSGDILSSAGDALWLGAGATVTNSGLLSAGNDGINVDGTATVVNTETGVIVADVDGIDIDGDGANVDNAGGITAEAVGVQIEGDDAVVVNQETGVINAADSGVVVVGDNADVSNAGAILASGLHGVYVTGDDALVGNTGEIYATNDAIFVVGERASVSNDGYIYSDAVGIEVAGNDAVVENGDTIFSMTHAIIVTGDRASVTNDDSIEAVGTGIVVEGDDAVIINNGTVDAWDDGIYVFGDNANVANDGTIGAYSVGIFVEGHYAIVTNSGTLKTDEEGIYADGYTAQITNSGMIDARDVGIYVDHGDAIVTNTGTIVSFDDGVVIDGDHSTVINEGLIDVGTRHNNGTVDAEATGIVAGYESFIVNSGTVLATRDGVYVDGASYVENSGTIEAVRRGIDAETDEVTVVNTGVITSANDGILVGEYATVFNSGTVTTTANGDALDLDSGDVINHGSLIALGSGDGIGFDDSTENSTVLNTGLIQGVVGISDEVGPVRSIVISNSGTITGTSGVAIDLKDGDDTLWVHRGSKINGVVEMGGGDDALIITHDGFERVDVGSAIEYVEGQATVLIGTNSVVQLDDDALVEGDYAVQRLAFGIARDALSAPAGTGFWATGNLANLSANDSTAAGVALGFDHGMSDASSIGLFLNRSRAAEVDSTVVGLRYALSTGAGNLTAMAYTGQTTGKELAGDEGADGRTYGVGLRYGHTLRAAAPGAVGFDVALEGGWSKTALDAYALTDLNANIGARDVSGGYTRLELGAPVQLSNGAALRGYVAASRFTGSSDVVAASIEGASARIDGVDLGHTAYSIGGTYSHQTASGLVLNAGVEASFGQDDNRDVSARFSVRMPLGR